MTSGYGADALFKSSITSRRFPALRALTSDDVEVMALPPRPSPEKRAQKAAAAGAKNRLFDPGLVKPSAVSNLSPIAGARAGAAAGGSLPASSTGEKKSKPKAAVPLADRPPFRPCNPAGAREAISLDKTGFVGMHSPFDLGYRQRLKERQEAASLRLGGTFLPPSRQQAKDDTSVNYYLNSPDAETIEAERRYIQEKVRSHNCAACPPLPDWPLTTNPAPWPSHTRARRPSAPSRRLATWSTTTAACARSSQRCARPPTELAMFRDGTGRVRVGASRCTCSGWRRPCVDGVCLYHHDTTLKTRTGQARGAKITGKIGYLLNNNNHKMWPRHLCLDIR